MACTPRWSSCWWMPHMRFTADRVSSRSQASSQERPGSTSASRLMPTSTSRFGPSFLYRYLPFWLATLAERAYGELALLERDVAERTGALPTEKWLADLDRIERTVARIRDREAAIHGYRPRMASPPPDCAACCARALARAAAGIGSSSVRGRSDMTMLLTKPNLPQPAANWSVPTRRAELGQYARVACKLRSHTQKGSLISDMTSRKSQVAAMVKICSTMSTSSCRLRTLIGTGAW